jgi:hypothetical protein
VQTVVKGKKRSEYACGPEWAMRAGPWEMREKENRRGSLAMFLISILKFINYYSLGKAAR